MIRKKETTQNKEAPNKKNEQGYGPFTSVYMFPTYYQQLTPITIICYH